MLGLPPISGGVEPSLRSDWSLLPGNGILPPETNVCKRSPKSDLTFAETDRSHTTAPIRGVSTKGRKISVREGLCGGAGSTRTGVDLCTFAKCDISGGIKRQKEFLTTVAPDRAEFPCRDCANVLLPLFISSRLGGLLRSAIPALDRRLKAFATSIAESIALLATIPGCKKEETWLHDRLGGERVRGEFFEFKGPLEYFLYLLKTYNLEKAREYLTETHPATLALRAETGDGGGRYSDVEDGDLAEHFAGRTEAPSRQGPESAVTRRAIGQQAQYH